MSLCVFLFLPIYQCKLYNGGGLVLMTVLSVVVNGTILHNNRDCFFIIIIKFLSFTMSITSEGSSSEIKWIFPYFIPQSCTWSVAVHHIFLHHLSFLVCTDDNLCRHIRAMKNKIDTPTSRGHKRLCSRRWKCVCCEDYGSWCPLVATRRESLLRHRSPAVTGSYWLSA